MGFQMLVYNRDVMTLESLSSGVRYAKLHKRYSVHTR
jgi:hypothetical protein